jgi:hypothetical protein
MPVRHNDNEEDEVDTATPSERRDAFLIFSNEAMLLARYDGPIDEDVLRSARATATARWGRCRLSIRVVSPERHTPDAAPALDRAGARFVASLIPLQLPLAPMGLFPPRSEHTLLVPVQRPHDADPGEHRRAAARNKHQCLHRGLPFRRHVLGSRKLGDVVAGVLQRHKLATARQIDRMLEGPLPADGIFATNRFHLRLAILVPMGLVRARRSAKIISSQS